MENYTIKIPVKRYIRKYISSVYGDPLKPTFKDDFGDTVISKLASRPLVRLSKSDLNIFLLNLNDTLAIKLPVDYFYRIDNTITSQHIYTLNRYFENVFKKEFYVYVNICTAFGVQRITAIESFCKRHGIQPEEDITLTGLVKMEGRYRKEKEANKDFLVGLSSLFQNHILGVAN